MIKNDTDAQLNAKFPFPCKKGTLLKKYSTFGIGGPARYFTEARTLEQMQERVAYACLHSLPLLVIGKGSNSLFDDRGFNGLVILNRLDSLEKREEGRFCAGAGYSFARLGGVTARAGWSGLEFAAGIPASVGGAIYMNAGANGQETSDVLEEVGYVLPSGELARFKRAELEFSYRASTFQKMQGVIVEGVFKLTLSNEAQHQQHQLLKYRLQTQPYSEKSAGCAFRNPPGVSAGRLIEELGLKGLACNGAAISTQHANFIVNKGNASAEDVQILMEKIQEKVYQERGIHLEQEIRFIPYE